MRTKYFIFLIIVILSYSTAFLSQEKLYNKSKPQLSLVSSAKTLHVISGYLYQVVAETIFVKAAVFLGNNDSDLKDKKNSLILSHNFKQITDLYPEFIDPYFYTQSYLPHISQELAEDANYILDTGWKAHPGRHFLPFFQGYNYFRHLNNPLKAAEIFKLASLHPNAPLIFDRLHLILSVEGGQIKASIIALTSLLHGEKDEKRRARYNQEIGYFKSALEVQYAVKRYFNEKKIYPQSLNKLVPDYLDNLPTFGNSFILTWNSPVVGLSRPKKY